MLLTYLLHCSIAQSLNYALTHSLTHSLNHLLTYLLTYSIEQSPTWEANRFSAFKELPASYGTRRYIAIFTSTRHLSLYSARTIQSMPPHHFLKNHLNFILPSTPTAYKCSLVLRFLRQNSLYIIPLPHTCYMPAHLIFLGLITRLFKRDYRSLSSSLCSFLFSLLPRPS